MGLHFPTFCMLPWVLTVAVPGAPMKPCEQARQRREKRPEKTVLIIFSFLDEPHGRSRSLVHCQYLTRKKTSHTTLTSTLPSVDNGHKKHVVRLQ